MREPCALFRTLHFELTLLTRSRPPGKLNDKEIAQPRTKRTSARNGALRDTFSTVARAALWCVCAQNYILRQKKLRCRIAFVGLARSQSARPHYDAVEWDCGRKRLAPLLEVPSHVYGSSLHHHRRPRTPLWPRVAQRTFSTQRHCSRVRLLRQVLWQIEGLCVRRIYLRVFCPSTSPVLNQALRACIDAFGSTRNAI